MLSRVPWIFPHTSVLTPNVHTLPPAVLGTSMLLQIISVFCVAAGQSPQVESMVYNSRHPGTVPLHVNVNNSGGPRAIFEREIDAGEGSGPSQCNVHASGKKMCIVARVYTLDSSKIMYLELMFYASCQLHLHACIQYWNFSYPPISGKHCRKQTSDSLYQ